MLVQSKEQYKEYKKKFVPKMDAIFGTNRPYPVMYFNDELRQIFTYSNWGWKKSEIINYDDIIKLVTINDLTDKKGHPLIKAAAGGALIGGIGAILGAMSGGTKTKGLINKLELDLYLKDKTVFHLNLVDPSLPQKTTSDTGKTAIADFDNWKVKIDEIINLNELNSKENSNDNINDLKQLKQLADDGVITQDEFEAKKKQILGL